MTYLKLRVKVYIDELKQMLSSIRQLFIFISLLFNMALPVAVLTALISLSVIESSHTAISSRISYQWGYFIFLFFLIRVQRKAIFGDRWHLYLASTPTTKIQKHGSNIILASVAGNLPLLVPIFLLIFNLSFSLFTDHLYFLLFVIATLFTTWFALKCRHFPWVSLLLFPLFMSFYETELPETFSSKTLNFYWLIMFLIDCFYKPVAAITKARLPLKYYWQIKWIEVKENPTPTLSRILICSLLIILVSYTQNKLDTIATNGLQIGFCYIISLVLGSFQFDNEKFNLRYKLYLTSTLYNSRDRYLSDVIPSLFFSFVIAITLNQYLSFSFLTFVLLPIGTVITIISVTKHKQNFFIIPSVLFICLIPFT